MDIGKHLPNLWSTLTVELPEKVQANRKQRNITIQLTSKLESKLNFWSLPILDQVAGLLKSGNKKAFTSLFVPETEMVQYRAPI